MEPIFAFALKLPPSGSRRRMRTLHAQLRDAIVNGRLKADVALPPSRELAKAYDISRNAVLAAYDLLQSEGYVVARRGAGTFVARLHAPAQRDRNSRAPAPKYRLNSYWSRATFERNESQRTPKFNFGLGLPDASAFPFAVWRRLIARTLRTAERQVAHYADPQGEFHLRHAIAQHVSFARAVACKAEDIVVTSGAQQAFDLLARVLLAKSRNVVAVEEPGYPPLRAAFAAAGAKLVHVPVDKEGMIVQRLPRDVAVICITPSHQFPLGCSLTARRRAELLEFARRHRAAIIEDDYDGEFRFTSQPLDALKTLDRDESTFYVGTFSKSMLPDLRMGFIVAPGWVLNGLVAAKKTSDQFTDVVKQRALAAFIGEGYLLRHVRRVRRLYAERRSRLLDGLAEQFHRELSIVPATAGLHICALAIKAKNLEPLVARARSHGVYITSLKLFYSDNAFGSGLIFGYGAIEAAQIPKGLTILRQLWKS